MAGVFPVSPCLKEQTCLEHGSVRRSLLSSKCVAPMTAHRALQTNGMAHLSIFSSGIMGTSALMIPSWTLPVQVGKTSPWAVARAFGYAYRTTGSTE